jgi:hypothetical protein
MNLESPFRHRSGIENEINDRKLVYVPLADRKLKPSVLAIMVKAKRGLPGAASAFLETAESTVSDMASAQSRMIRAN